MDSIEGLQALFEYSTEGILVTDKEGKIVKINPSAERMFGYADGELMGQKIEVLIPNKFKSSHKDHRESYREHPHARQMGIGMDLYGRMKDGTELPVEVSLSPYTAHDETFVIAFIIDITIRKKSEVALRKQKEELETLASKLSESNKELENFAYISSHDLQEPLRKIQAFGDRLQTLEGDKFSDQGKDYLGRMLNASGRMQRLIDDLLMFSRLTSAARPFTSIDLNQVLTGVLSDLEVLIEKTESTINIGDLPEIHGDPTQMRQLFQNLIQNAIKFSKPDQKPQIEISSKLAESEGRAHAEIRVKDNGIGFDPKYTDRIFNIFQRLDHKNYEGSGIGLAICRKIVTRHNGTIRAESKAGEGAEFIITLPLNKHE